MYIVIIDFIWHENEVWKTIQRSFKGADAYEKAREHAQWMKDHSTQKVAVYLYELKESWR